MSKVWYDFDNGVVVWGRADIGAFVYSDADWYAHWLDDDSFNRWFFASPTTINPHDTCAFLQAENPGFRLRFITIPARGLFPLGPATDPVFGPGTDC